MEDYNHQSDMSAHTQILYGHVHTLVKEDENTGFRFLL